MRKTVLIVLFLCLMLAGCAVKAPTEAPQPEIVTACTEAERVLFHDAYIIGDGECFFPQRKLLRCEIARILMVLRSDSPVDIGAITDVTGDSWYYEPVSRMGGYFDISEQGEFRPLDYISKAELRLVLQKAFYPSGFEPTFFDVFFAGQTEDSTVTRLEAVCLLNRILGRTPDETTDTHRSYFIDLSPEDAGYFEILEAAIPHYYLSDGSAERWIGEMIPKREFEPGFHVCAGGGFLIGEDGQTVRQKGIVSFDGELYLSRDESGLLYTDQRLHEYEGNVYLCSRSGKLYRNCSYGQYSFDADGCYGSGDEELDELIDAALAECTTPDMTTQEKMRAVFDHVRAMRYLGRNASLASDVESFPSELGTQFAKVMLKTGKGDCYNFAAACCYLMRAIGIEAQSAVGVCGYRWNSRPIAHGWVELTVGNTVLIYDPEIENYNIRQGIDNREHGAFGVSYAQAPAAYIKNEQKVK